MFPSKNEARKAETYIDAQLPSPYPRHSRPGPLADRASSCGDSAPMQPTPASLAALEPMPSLAAAAEASKRGSRPTVAAWKAS